jgi:hypothetical protein
LSQAAGSILFIKYPAEYRKAYGLIIC